MNYHEEVAAGQRFPFGENWRRFLSVLNESRISIAEQSLRDMLSVETFAGKTFLDIGSGSGLFSLAARRLGAKVHSFDYDPHSVACTAELRRRYFPDDPEWVVGKGSVLDKEYLNKLGTFDVIYSWGVLHHTGRMWDALGNVVPLIGTGGTVYISIYNDQGSASRRWKFFKEIYNKYRLLRGPLAIYALLRQWTLTFFRDAMRGRPFASWNNYRTTRGMSAWHDVIDWIGGYPFEVAKPEEILDFLRPHGLSLVRLRTCAGGIGCNEYVFVRGGSDMSHSRT